MRRSRRLTGCLLALSCAACSSSAGVRPDAGVGPDRFFPEVPQRDAGCTGTDAAASPIASASLDELRDSTPSLNADWRFSTDPGNQGVVKGFAAESFDDSGWVVIRAGKTWEEQGFAGYDGYAWYRKRIDVPAAWKGSAVKLVTSGVDDEYDLYVNGQLVKHYGAPGESVWSKEISTRIESFLRFGDKNLIAVRVNDWGNGGGMWRNVTLRRVVPLDPYRSFLPTPILDAHPEWVQLYWEAWRMAWEKISFGTLESGLAAAYLDEGFNEQIYQWDSSFMCLFARYGRRLFPVMPTLDNFYERQRSDGYIQRVYSQTDGKELGQPTPDEPMVNPPLFAWVEWEYYRTTGDPSRFTSVLPRLERYFEWLKANLRAPAGQGLYYQTGLGSGMDNTPRINVDKAAWVDMSIQQALAARHLSLMAQQLGLGDRAKRWSDEHEGLKADINRLLWNASEGFYHDLQVSGSQASTKHIGAFWAILAEVADDAQTSRLVEHLRDPKEFHRPHLFPSLAASDPSYTSRGHYWLGSVWAPTNYMLIKGLERRGHDDLAREAAESHLSQMAQVFASPPADEQMIAPDERDGDYRTIWECYSPDTAAPGTRWDDTYYSRQDFVGWSGLGPIALLLETVIGIDVRGAENRIVWTLSRTDRHGVQNLQVGASNLVDLVAEERQAGQPARLLQVKALRPFVLEVRQPGKPATTVEICAGQSWISLP